MAFDWNEYIAVARYLSGDSGAVFSEQAALRCAISRAYYAAFCHAKHYVHVYCGYVPLNDGTDHGNVVAKLREIRRTATASKLTGLRQVRNACDYDDAIPFTSASPWITEALRIVDELPIQPQHRL